MRNGQGRVIAQAQRVRAIIFLQNFDLLSTKRTDVYTRKTNRYGPEPKSFTMKPYDRNRGLSQCTNSCLGSGIYSSLVKTVRLASCSFPISQKAKQISHYAAT